MVRETRHLWVGNLPENITEERIKEHFKRYGPVQSVKVVAGGNGSGGGEEGSSGGVCATVAFVDICSAAKAHKADNRLEDRCLKTTYHEASLASLSSPHYTPSVHLHREPSNHPYTSPQQPSSNTSNPPLAARSPRYPGLSEEHSGYDRSSHFYDGRRDEGLTYNGPSVGPPGIRRVYPNDRDQDFSARGRLRLYPRPYGGGRAEQGDYRWGGNPPYRYVHPDLYPEEKVVRRVAVPTAPVSPPLSRATVPRTGRLPPTGKRLSRSGSESRSSSRSSSSTTSSSSSSRSTSSSSRSPSPRRVNSGISNTGLLTPVGGLGSPQDEKRPLAICVRNLPPWSTETSLREGLFHDYKKHGKVMAVRLLGSGNDRFAVVCFKKPEDAEKALDASREKLFFGVKIQVAPHEGVELDESECRAYDVEVDEYHPRATRTLFIGNLEKDVTPDDLKKHFEQFGDIIEIDIKKQSVSTFAFCQYSDIRSVVRAMRQMDGEHLGTNRIKLGFGKSMPTRCVWIDGVPETVTEQQLYDQFSRFGPVVHTIIDKEKGHALIFYETEKYASNAVMEMRGRVLNGRKLQIDFASRECQAAFFENLAKQGHQLPADRPWERREIEKEPGRYENTANRYSRYDRTRREGVFPTRTTANNRANTYNSTGNRTRGRYDNYDEFAPGRSYDEYSQGSGASYEDSYERELREYAGSQRFVDGVGNGGVTSSAPSGSRRHSFSPARRRDERSPTSPRTHSRDRSSLSPPSRVAYEDGETSSRRAARRSTSDHESYHSQSPPGSRTTSPPPRPAKSGTGVSSRLAPPPRSPGTPVTASPSREVTLLDDRSLPDPRDYRRRTNDLKDLVVRVSDVRRPPPAPPEAGHRSGVRLHRSSHTDEGEDLVTSSSGGPQDPRLLQRRVPEDPSSSGDEHPSDSERLPKKPRYSDVTYEKPVCVKRVADSSDSMPNFRRPRDARRENKITRRGGDPISSARHSEEVLQDPRYRRLSLPDAEDVHWHRDTVHVSSSCDAPADHSDTSPPGTPVRDERDDSADPPHHTLHHHHHHHHSHHHHHHRDRYHSVPLSLPLPRFAQQVRAHLSPRAASTSPKGSNLLRSPPFVGGTNSNVRGEPKDLSSIILDTPLSPGPRDSPSDSEESPLPSPCSPSNDLEQRIRALDEKYEKWSGSSRVVGANLSSAANDILNENSCSSVGSAGKNARLPRILDLEELRSQPSDILKTLLSKKSVFDEDSKRLENVGDKYEPKPFTAAPRTSKPVSLLPSPPLINVQVSRQPTTPPAVPSATPISSLPGVRLSSQQLQQQQQQQQPVTSSPSQVPRVCVSVPQVSKSQGSSPLHHPVVSQAVRPPASSPGLSPGVSPAHHPHLSPATPQSPASCLTLASSITTATTTTSTTSSTTPSRRTPTQPRSLRLDPTISKGDEEDSSGTGVVTVVADTRVTGVVSVTQTVSSSKSVLTTTTSLVHPLSSPSTQSVAGDVSYSVPERSSSDALPLVIKEEPCPEEISGSPNQRTKTDPLGLEDIKTKDCTMETKECKEVMDFSVSEQLSAHLKVEPVDLEDIKEDTCKVESLKSEGLKLESYKSEIVKSEVLKGETNNKEVVNNHKRRHSNIDFDGQYKVEGKSMEPELKRLKQEIEEERIHDKAPKERRDSRDARDGRKSDSRERKSRSGRREEAKENSDERASSKTCDAVKRKLVEKEDRKDDGHKKEDKKEKRRERLEEKPPDKLQRDKFHENKIEVKSSEKVGERNLEDRKEEKKEDKKEEKREEKYDDKKEEKREERKENVCEERFKSEGERRRHSEDKRLESREQKHKEKREKTKDKDRQKSNSGSSKHEKDFEKEKTKERDKEKEKEKTVDKEKTFERERVHEKEREKNHEIEREIVQECLEKEREKTVDKDKEKAVEKDRNKIIDKHLDKDRTEKERDKERERIRFNDRCRERDKERGFRLNHREASERTENKKDQRHINDHRNNERRRDSRQEMRHYHHRSYEASENLESSKSKSRKSHSLDTEDNEIIDQSKTSSQYHISDDSVTVNHDSCLPGMNEIHDTGKTDVCEEQEDRRADRPRDPRRRKHDSGKSDKSDGELRLKGMSNRNKFSPSHSSRLKSRTDSHEHQSATSDIPTSDEEGAQSKGASLSRRNSTSTKQQQQPHQIRIGKNKHSSKTKSIFDPESESEDSLTVSGGEADDGDEAPKKHSIFDIPADDGMYDMYDKVKARSFKLKQKQEEERRQQEIKQSQMQKHRQHKLKRERKVTATIHSDISDTEEEDDSIHGHKRSHIHNTSSEDDPMRKRRTILMSPNDTDDDLFMRHVKKKGSSQNTHKKESKHKIRPMIVSDVTTDDDAPSLPRYASNLKPTRVSNVVMSSDSARGCEDNIYTDSDVENEAPSSRRPNKCLKQRESDSDISDIQPHAKPPKPASRVKIRDKERKCSRAREKPKNISKETITTSEESDVALTADIRPHRLKGKSDALDLRQDKPSLQPQRERKRTGESGLTREKISSKKDERMEAIFGLISDDSDPTPPLPRGRPASATTRRKGSSSSGASTAPPPLSPAPTRLSVCEVYDSDSDDTHMLPSSPTRHGHTLTKPFSQDPLWLESKPDLKIEPRNKIDRNEERRNMKRERNRHDELLPSDVRSGMDIMKGSSSSAIASSGIKNISPVEIVNQSDMIHRSNRKEPESHESASLHMESHECTDDEVEEQRDTRKDKKKKKKHKDKDGSRSSRHYRHIVDQHSTDQENDNRSSDHSAHLKVNAVSPDRSHSNLSHNLLTPREKMNISSRVLKPVSPQSQQNSVQIAENFTLPSHVPSACSPSESSSLPSPPVKKSNYSSQESVESQNSESSESKKGRSPHPLAALASDAAESAVQSLTTQVPPSTHEPIFEDITEVSNLSAPESNMDVGTGSTGKASRAVISQEETLNAVAGLLACYDDYSEDAGVPPTDEETLLPPDSSTSADDASEEAQKAAQMLQCEMPGEREESWAQQTSHNPPGNQSKPSSDTNSQLAGPSEEEEQETGNESQQYSQLSPDSPASMQSEPELQIDEDQPDPSDDMETPATEDLKLENHIQDEDSPSSVRDSAWVGDMSKLNQSKSSPCKSEQAQVKCVPEHPIRHSEKVGRYHGEKIATEGNTSQLKPTEVAKRMPPVMPVHTHSQSSTIPLSVTSAKMVPHKASNVCSVAESAHMKTKMDASEAISANMDTSALKKDNTQIVSETKPGKLESKSVTPSSSLSNVLPVGSSILSAAPSAKVAPEKLLPSIVSADNQGNNTVGSGHREFSKNRVQESTFVPESSFAGVRSTSPRSSVSHPNSNTLKSCSSKASDMPHALPHSQTLSAGSATSSDNFAKTTSAPVSASGTFSGSTYTTTSSITSAKSLPVPVTSASPSLSPHVPLQVSSKAPNHLPLSVSGFQNYNTKTDNGSSSSAASCTTVSSAELAVTTSHVQAFTSQKTSFSALSPNHLQRSTFAQKPTSPPPIPVFQGQGKSSASLSQPSTEVASIAQSVSGSLESQKSSTDPHEEAVKSHDSIQSTTVPSHAKLLSPEQAVSVSSPLSVPSSVSVSSTLASSKGLASPASAVTSAIPTSTLSSALPTTIPVAVSASQTTCHATSLVTPPYASQTSLSSSPRSSSRTPVTMSAHQSPSGVLSSPSDLPASSTPSTSTLVLTSTTVGSVSQASVVSTSSSSVPHTPLVPSVKPSLSEIGGIPSTDVTSAVIDTSAKKDMQSAPMSLSVTTPEPVDTKAELEMNKALKSEIPGSESESRVKSGDEILLPVKSIKSEDVQKSELPDIKNSNLVDKSKPGDGTVPPKEAVKGESGIAIPAVEHALASLETIVSETAAQPQTEDISQPPTEEASLVNKKPCNVTQPKELIKSPPQPQDEFAKLEKVCSEIQSDGNVPSEVNSVDTNNLDIEEVMKDDDKVQERSSTARGGRRKRGRGRGRQTIDVHEEESNNVLPVTRSGVSIRGKGRGRGRQTRNSESQQEVQAEVKETVQPEIRRSSRTKRARRHPDMVDHDETSGRRRRGRGGRAAHVEDSRPLPLRTSSDVYDFHESEDEDINIGLSKTKIKKDVVKSAAGRSPVKLDVEEIPVIDNENKSLAPTTRRSGRLRDKVVDDEVNIKDTAEDQASNEPIIILDSSTSVQPVSTSPTAATVTTSSAAGLTTSRGRGRGKQRDNDVDDDSAPRKSPRGQIRPMEPQAESDKVSVVTSKAINLVASTSCNTTLSSNVATVTTTTVTATSTSTAPSIEERKSEAELVDPVTGVVTRVKVCVEGQYVTDSGETAVVPTTPASTLNDHNKQVSEIAAVSTVSSFSPSVSIVNVCSPVEKLNPSVPTVIGSRPGVTMTVVNSSDIVRPTISAGRTIGSDVSVELVTRPRAPIQVGRQVTSAVSVSSAVTSMPGNLSTAVPTLPTTSSTLMTLAQAPVRAAMPAAVTMSQGMRYIAKPKTVQVQPQQPTQHLPHQQGMQALPQQPALHPMQQQPKPSTVKPVTGPAPQTKLPIGNPVMKPSAPGPAPACYPHKNLVPVSMVGPTQVHVRPSVVAKASNPSNPPKPTDLQMKGNLVPSGPVPPYESAHSRVGPATAVEDGSPHHRMYREDQYVSVHTHYSSNPRFLEPPRVDVTRLPGSSPSATSPAGRPHEAEAHNPAHHSAVPGYDMHAVAAAAVAHSHSGPAAVVAAAAAAMPASSSSSSSVPVAPKGGLPHYYHAGGDIGECPQQPPVALHHPHHPSQLKASGGGGGVVLGGGGGGEHYLTSPPLSTPPSAHTPPPAHQHMLQGEMMRVPTQFLPHVYPSQYYGPVYGDKIMTPLPLDMKLVDKNEAEKHETSSGGGGGRGTPGPPEFAGRGSGGPTNLAPRGQSSPHVLASPHHDRSTDSPQVAMVYSRLYDRFYYPGRSATPGAPGSAEHEAQGHISSPSAVAHVYSNIPSAEVHHQMSSQQFVTQIPRQLQVLLQGSDVTWAGLLGLKQDHAAVQMYYVSGCSDVARGALPVHPDGTTSPIRIGQRMRLEQTQLEGVARKIQMEAEHCVLLALPHGRDSYDFMQQQNNLRNGIINYLVVKQAAGIVNVIAPGSHQPAYVVHIFPPCDFANENLARISPDLLHRVAEISYLLVVIATC